MFSLKNTVGKIYTADTVWIYKQQYVSVNVSQMTFRTNSVCLQIAFLLHIIQYFWQHVWVYSSNSTLISTLQVIIKHINWLNYLISVKHQTK